ncbi:MAG: RluA family pseudouridine synthase [Candidatus Sericytochromatia bacterium]|nr:RluA family pseudouridine synthase [Candidatus Sericytochromatia bacterium]
MTGRHECLVPAEAAGTRLDVYLASLMPDWSRARLQALIDRGDVLLSDGPCKAGQRLKGGERLTVTWPEAVAYHIEPVNLELDILYQDAALAVVNKPRGMPTHPAPGSWQDTLVHGLLHALDGLSGIGGTLRPGIVHRLDKDTTGLLVVAKSDEAHLALGKAMQAREIKRTYLALVHGRPALSPGTIDRPLGRHPRDRLKYAVVAEGKPARTHYATLESWRDVSLLELQLETGRTHQIRVHLASIGHPVVGDRLYGPGGPSPTQLKGQLLHAARLSLQHPITGKPMTFEAPLPQDFEKALGLVKRKGGWRS